MKFKSFYQKLNESPHALLYGDMHFDFRREDGTDWILKLVELYKNHKNKVKEMTSNLLNDMFFKIAFKTDIKKIPQGDLDKIKQVLPKEFFK